MIRFSKIKKIFVYVSICTLITVYFQSCCCDDENKAFIIFHVEDQFKNDNIFEFMHLLDRTNKLKNYLDLDSLPQYVIYDYISYSDTTKLESEFNKRKNYYPDTIHIFVTGNSPIYNPNRNVARIIKGQFESEKILLHELIHHRLDDINNLFPHYYDDVPKCQGDTSFWCTNLMTTDYVPFSVMLTEKQHTTIQDKNISREYNYFCQERHVYPKDQIYLTYQDSIVCCPELDLENIDTTAFINTIPNSQDYNEMQLNDFYIELTDTMRSLHMESEAAFCSPYLSLEFINRLRDVIAQKRFQIVVFDTLSNGTIKSKIETIKINIDRPDGMSDSIVLLSAVNLHIISQLQRADIIRYSRKEAEIMSTVYDEDANKIFYRNMSLYQKTLLTEMSKQYTQDGIPFFLNKDNLKNIWKNYHTYESLGIKGINFKGIDLYLSKNDLVYLIESM